jgi:hypothetical protein
MFFDEFKNQIGHEVEEYELGVRAPGRTVEIVACKIHEFLISMQSCTPRIWL